MVGVEDVVQDHDGPTARQLRAPARGQLLDALARDLLRRDVERAEQRPQRGVRAERLPALGESVQVQIKLGVRVVGCEPVRGVHGETRLADTGHAVDGDRPADIHRGQDSSKLRPAGGEV